MNSPTTKKAGFTLVEIMIVVLIIGILLAIAIPNFVAARESSRAKACIGNLKQIDSAKQQSAMDNKLSGADTTSKFKIDVTTPTAAAAAGAGTYQLAGPTGYIRATPACPSTGAYDPGLGVSTVPVCAIGTAGATTDYAGPLSTTSQAIPGKFYHGLVN